MAESNELIEKVVNIDRDNIPLEKEKWIFNKLVDVKSYELKDLEKNN